MRRIKQLNEASEMGEFVQKIEKLMDDNNIKIMGSHLCLVINDVEYKIGRDQDQFPRFVEEPFWREIDE